MGWGLVPEWKQQRQSFGSGVSKIWNNINSIWDQLNVEYKKHDVTASVTPTSTPQFVSLTNIAAGITGSESGAGIDTGYRDGDKIRVKTLNLKCLLRNTSATMDVGWVYLIKHYDNFSASGTGSFSWNQIYYTSSGSANATRLRTSEYEKQYKILARRRIPMAGIEDASNEKLVNIFIKHKRRVGSYIEWEGSLSTDPSNGKYYLVYFSDNNSSMSMTYSARTVYIDN